MATKPRYDIEDLVEALRTEPNVRQALIKVGLAPAGGNYTTAQGVIKRFNIDVSHMMTRNLQGPRKDTYDPSKERTKEEWKIALETSDSIRQAVKKLGCQEIHGGHYRKARRIIKEYGMDVSHMTGQGWNKGDKMGLLKRTNYLLDEILVEDSTYACTQRLKNRLLSEGLKGRYCEDCGRTSWNGQPIPLELDHVNGKRHDNRIENIKLLCPNCHAQTPTYRGKNIGRANRHAGVMERKTWDA